MLQCSRAPLICLLLALLPAIDQLPSSKCHVEHREGATTSPRKGPKRRSMSGVSSKPPGDEGAQARKYPVDNSRVIEIPAYAPRAKR